MRLVSACQKLGSTKDENGANCTIGIANTKVEVEFQVVESSPLQDRFHQLQLARFGNVQRAFVPRALHVDSPALLSPPRSSTDRTSTTTFPSLSRLSSTFAMVSIHVSVSCRRVGRSSWDGWWLWDGGCTVLRPDAPSERKENFC